MDLFCLWAYYFAPKLRLMVRPGAFDALRIELQRQGKHGWECIATYSAALDERLHAVAATLAEYAHRRLPGATPSLLPDCCVGELHQYLAARGDFSAMGVELATSRSALQAAAAARFLEAATAQREGLKDPSVDSRRLGNAAVHAAERAVAIAASPDLRFPALPLQLLEYSASAKKRAWSAQFGGELEADTEVFLSSFNPRPR